MIFLSQPGNPCSVSKDDPVVEQLGLDPAPYNIGRYEQQLIGQFLQSRLFSDAEYLSDSEGKTGKKDNEHDMRGFRFSAHSIYGRPPRMSAAMTFRIKTSGTGIMKEPGRPYPDGKAKVGVIDDRSSTLSSVSLSGGPAVETIRPFSDELTDVEKIERTDCTLRSHCGLRSARRIASQSLGAV